MTERNIFMNDFNTKISYKKRTPEDNSSGNAAGADAKVCHSSYDYEKKRTSDYWIEKICPVCGRHIYPPTEEWAYRRGEEYMCSWHCLCVYDRRREARSRADGVPKGRLPSEKMSARNSTVKRDYRRGISVIELARRYNLSRTQIYRIIAAQDSDRVNL